MIKRSPPFKSTLACIGGYTKGLHKNQTRILPVGLNNGLEKLTLMRLRSVSISGFLLHPK